MKYFFFRPTDEEFISSLKTLGYRFLKKMDDNWLKGRIKGGKKILSEFIYIDVSPVIVKDLRMSTRTLPPNTSKERNKGISSLRERIEAFKREHVIR